MLRYTVSSETNGHYIPKNNWYVTKGRLSSITGMKIEKRYTITLGSPPGRIQPN